MRYLTVKDFLNEDINIDDIRVLPIKERVKMRASFKKRAFSVIFLYLAGQRRYTPNEGDSFLLNPGDILYVPEGSTYSFCILEGDPFDYAIAINFSLKDRSGEPVCIGRSPSVIACDAHQHYETLFLRALNTDAGAKSRALLLKSDIYRLFYEIFTEKLHKEYADLPWKAILPAIDRIESRPADDTSIPELARLSGVCETKLRKLFLQYTDGLSPIQYRNKLRMEQAMRSLKTEEMTVEQAARDAGFKDMAHFYRLYKKERQK